MIKTIEESDLKCENTTIGITAFELICWVVTLTFGIGPVIAILMD
jgi:hypothetical protein